MLRVVQLPSWRDSIPNKLCMGIYNQYPMLSRRESSSSQAIQSCTFRDKSSPAHSMVAQHGVSSRGHPNATFVDTLLRENRDCFLAPKARASRGSGGITPQGNVANLVSLSGISCILTSFLSPESLSISELESRSCLSAIFGAVKWSKTAGLMSLHNTRCSMERLGETL